MNKTKKVKKNSEFTEVWSRLRKNRRAMICLVICLIIFLLAVFADVLFDYDEMVVKQNVREKMEGFSWAHPLGTDQVGRDMLARIVHGTRTALLMGFGGVLLSVIVAIPIACAAAFFGGKTDIVIMWFSDVLNTVPQLVLALAVCAGLGNGLWQLVVALSVGGIAPFIRLIRSQALTVTGMEYIEAGKAMGASTIRIIFKYILPNTMSVILVQASANISHYILMGATLSFIGLGVKAPMPEWGCMLSEGLSYYQFFPRLVVVPGVAILITSLVIATLGDCLRDAFDPMLKGKA